MNHKCIAFLLTLAASALTLVACQAALPPAPTVVSTPRSESAVRAPIDVTYFTPAQSEGPYYPVDKPADRDNDLTVMEGATGVPAGHILQFSGRVHDAVGMPIENAVVEIWQTDANGIYLHPRDPQTAQRDPNFQFYGEAVTAVDGSYRFRTVLPGHYEPRPRHIHVKLKRDEEELLTTQIYFDGDPSLEADGIFLGGGAQNEYLLMALTQQENADGIIVLIGRHDFILNVE